MMDLQPPAWYERLTVLQGLRLSRISRAADMAMLAFGALRPRPPKAGMAGQYALHIQCHWRLDGAEGTVTGQTDLREFGGHGEMPAGWDYESGSSVQDRVLDGLFGKRRDKQGWLNETDRFVVVSIYASAYGDLQIDFSHELTLRVFPDTSALEAWRFFVPDADSHLVYRAGAQME